MRSPKQDSEQDLMGSDIGEKTIADFGEQWSRYPESSGYFGSLELFRDIVGPLVGESDLDGKVVAEIGSGAGRVVNMLCDAGARKVYALEPSPAAYAVLEKNTVGYGAKVECRNLRGDELPPGLDLDFVFAVGVIQFIPDADPVVGAAFHALKKNGKCFFWIYGKEGTSLYTKLIIPLRKVTVILPHFALSLLCHLLNASLDAYIFMCRYLPLPLRGYIRNVIGRFPRSMRYLTIYDQLNPTYAKFYTESEAKDLLARGGFTDIRTHHRHGYSWSIIGTRP